MPENPLARLLPVEERVDGVYIQVDRSARDAINPAAIERALAEAMVANADMAKIKDVLTRGRGVFEKVGPLFEYYDDRLESFLDIKSRLLDATVNIGLGLRAAGVRLNPVLLEYALRRRKVVYGINRDMLREICAKSLFDADIPIAQGTPPVAGVDGSIHFEIKIDPDAKPAIGSDGKADYRSIESFVTVTEGQILARRIPPKPGTPGTAVSGDPIPAQSGADVALPSGQNTAITDDNTVLRAGRGGVVFMQSGMLTILELLHINKDVDFSVGNVKYTGDVLIHGSVRPGFSVEADGNIEIGGEVEAAKITSRNGIVTIRQGVIGRKDAKIFARQGITVGFAQEADLVSEGIIHVDKHLMHCTVTCTQLEADSLIGGLTKVFGSAHVNNIGNESGIETPMFILDRNAEKLKEKLTELVTLRTKMSEQMEPIQKELRTKTAMMKRSGVEITDRHRAELKKWIDAYNDLAARMKLLDDNIAKINGAIKNPQNLDGSIHASGRIMPNVRVDFYGLGRHVVTDVLHKKVFRLRDGIVSEGEE